MWANPSSLRIRSAFWTVPSATAARIWDGPVFGTATSQNATNGLRHAGVLVAANTTRLLADLSEGRIPPGSLIVADEGSMISMTHLAALADYAARNGCKLVLAGDQEQLAAVEGGGAMPLLADRLGYVQLAEPMRFAAEWERAASLRLRQGDAAALDEYDQHGRIRGAPPEQAMDQAAYAYVASYLADRDVLLMAADWARCRELSARIREDLIHLGLVDATRSILIADGAQGSVGDLRGYPADRGRHRPGHHGPSPPGAGPDDRAAALHRPGVPLPGYRSAELAYAVTGHSAQGGTVHTGIALVTGGKDRQWYPNAAHHQPARMADPTQMASICALETRQASDKPRSITAATPVSAPAACRPHGGRRQRGGGLRRLIRTSKPRCSLQRYLTCSHSMISIRPWRVAKA